MTEDVSPIIKNDFPYFPMLICWKVLSKDPLKTVGALDSISFLYHSHISTNSYRSGGKGGPTFWESLEFPVKFEICRVP